MCQKVGFHCDRCGQCCRNIKLFGNLYAWLRDAHGNCRYFDNEHNLCSIYPIRPIICRVEDGHGLYFANMPYSEYLIHTRQCCNMLKHIDKNK